MTTDVSANIASHLVAMAQRQPDSPAIFYRLKLDRHGKIRHATCTYRQLNDQSDALARGFLSLGITAGTRTALCLRPGVDFFAATFALFKIGAIPVLIDPGIGLKNFGRCLTSAQPAAFIGIPLAHALRRALRWAHSTIRINITTGTFGGVSLKNLARSSAPNYQLPITNCDTPAAILFTSGSTGPPKGVLYTHANFSAQIAALRAEYHIEPGELDLATFPLFALFAPALGMTSIIPTMNFTRPGRVAPQHILEPIRQLQATSLFGSPALIQRVGEWGRRRDIKLPSLRRVISAGAPVPSAALEAFSAMLTPGTQIFTPYGATEALPVCSIGSREILGDTRQRTDRGAGVCVGRPVAGIQVRIIKITDAPIPFYSDDLELPQGQIGEIIVQGPVVTSEYFNNPAATDLAKIFISQTPAPDEVMSASPQSKIENRKSKIFFHRMGDLGYLDPTGRLWFCGRKSQRVRTPAGDLYSTPFEAIFNTHPQVHRSALVGVMHSGVIRPVICIELRPGRRIDRRTLLAELRTLAAAHEHTRIIQDFLVHPRFPVDIRHNAKIGREKLAVWAARKLR